MLPHVPFDGWTWTAVENGSVDIGFKKKETPESRLLTYQNLFADGSIDFIDCFSDFIDVEVKNKYEALVSKPERIPQKIKTIILIRLELCQMYKESIRCSLSITALPNNSKKSFGNAISGRNRSEIANKIEKQRAPKRPWGGPGQPKRGPTDIG